MALYSAYQRAVEDLPHAVTGIRDLEPEDLGLKSISATYFVPLGKLLHFSVLQSSCL